MQVVIDVPDKVYEMVMNTGTYGCYRFNSAKAIREGIPLPKGHGKLKDVSEFTPDSEWDYYDDEYIAISMGQIISAPTIIEADEEGEVEK